MSAAPVPLPSAPTSSPPRLLTPDFARGIALLGIAMANLTTIWIVHTVPDAIGSTVGWVNPDSPLDMVAAIFSTLFIHVRGLPMFSTLLGFGIGLLANSLYRKNYPAKDARRVLVRRYGFLALFGFAHLFFLFKGDIMFLYGLAGMLIATMITLRTKTLRTLAYISLGLMMVFSVIMAVVAGFIGEPAIEYADTEAMVTPGDYFRKNALEGLLFVFNSLFGPIMLGGVMVIGFIWAREGVLVNIDAHRTTLYRWIALTVGVILVIGLQWGLAAVGVYPETFEYVFESLNYGFGLLTGPGILAIIALLLNGAQKRANAGATPKWMYPFIALGKRSMSGYLAQSFLIIPLVMPFGLGLGIQATISEKLLIAFGVWLITLVLATILEATNTPGPFEWLHRRLAYGKTGRLEPYSAPAPAVLPAQQPHQVQSPYNGPHVQR